MTSLQAQYQNWSDWDLDEMGIDIRKVHDWYIKQDTLHIQREENGEWEEFEGFCEQFDYKRPGDIYLTSSSARTCGEQCDCLKVENGQLIK